MTLELGELFTESKEVLAEYHAKVEEFEKQEAQLHSDLVSLQNEMKDNLLQQQKAESDVSKMVDLKMSHKTMAMRVEVIEGFLQELEDKKTALKIAVAPLLRDGLARDRGTSFEKHEDVKGIVNKYRYMMLNEISEIGKVFYRQYRNIAPEVEDIFKDKAVLEIYPRLEYAFHDDQYKPSFSWLGDTVISKNDVFTATRGGLPDGIKKPENI